MYIHTIHSVSSVLRHQYYCISDGITRKWSLSLSYLSQSLHNSCMIRRHRQFLGNVEALICFLSNREYSIIQTNREQNTSASPSVVIKISAALLDHQDREYNIIVQLALIQFWRSSWPFYSSDSTNLVLFRLYLNSA